jgi:hypothetical protein
MRNLAVLVIHLIAKLARLLGPGGVRSLVAESLLLKYQLLIVNRSRQRSPNLSAGDRILAGLLALLVHPTRPLRSAIALKPSTLLALHKALSKGKYRTLFSPNRRRQPGPKGSSVELIHAVVEMKQRNPTGAVRELHNRSPWRSTSKSTKTWFAGCSPVSTGRDRTPAVPLAVSMAAPLPILVSDPNGCLTLSKARAHCGIRSTSKNAWNEILRYLRSWL